MLSRTLSAYLAQDRRAALARGVALPERCSGAALFADISGFTRLTAVLVNDLGPQRGADELSRRLNQIYGALVEAVERFGGSVIGYAGDAITCWFDDAGSAPASAAAPPDAERSAPRAEDAAVRRAAACAVAMQEVLRGLATVVTPSGESVALAIKVAVAAGEARRFQVGAPEIQLLDVLAGATLQRLAAADHAAGRGEVLLDEAAAAALGELAEVSAWRTDDEGARFAVLAGLRAEGAAAPPAEAASLDADELRPWLLPAVYSRVLAGQEQLLAELRPVAVLFLSFAGIDYDGDPEAGERLDAFIRWSQRTVHRLGGTLLALTIGDKGSYFYCAFGAPAAHEDDAVRAVMAAAQLRTPPPELGFVHDIRTGVSLGRTYSGAYGGPTRCTYGVLGNEVNLAARLMQAAGSGQVLASEPAARVAGAAFGWEQLPPLTVKGRVRPIAAARLLGVRSQSPMVSQLLFAGLPLVGRSAEMARIDRQMERALAGEGQVVAVIGEAGMGKSRVVNESVRRAVGRRMEVFAGEGQSYGATDSYLVWHAIWQSFFRLDRDASPEEQAAALERELAAINPQWLPRLPLLGPALNLRLPDSELTASLDPRLRKLSLEDLLVSCLRARAAEAPQMLVLEDAHWMDALSHDLLEAIGLAIVDVPVLVVVAFRPPELSHLQAPRVTLLPNCTQVPLGELSESEAVTLAELKQVHLDSPEPLPPDVLARIVERTQGNPFYIEELISYLHDRGLSPRSAQDLERMDVPASLSTLILSRIDQLGERERATLKVASVIGRSFRAAWLWGFYPNLGEPSAVRADLESLIRLDLTLPEVPEPAASYLFKHILTHGVAYESLPYQTRAWLHEQLATFIEQSYAAALDQFVDLLAHHYDRTNNQPKRREYLLRAGDQARAEYANAAAIDYYRRLLPLLADEEQGAARFRLGQVLELVGEWDEAAESYGRALDLALAAGDVDAEAAVLRAVGRLQRKRGRYPEALESLARARQVAAAIGDTAGTAQAQADAGEVFRLQGDYASAARSYDECLATLTGAATREMLAARANALKGAGTLAAQQGDYAAAAERYEQSLSLQRAIGDKPGVVALLNNLGMLATYREDLAAARRIFDEGLEQARAVGDLWAVGSLLNNAGNAARYQAEPGAARALLEESVAVRRRLGDRWGVANSLGSLTNLLIHTGELAGVPAMLAESLALNAEIGDRTAVAYCLEDAAGLAAASGAHARALRLAGAAASLRAAVGSPLPPAEQAALDTLLAPARAALADPAAEYAAGQALAADEAVALASAADRAP